MYQVGVRALISDSDSLDLGLSSATLLCVALGKAGLCHFLHLECGQSSV